MALSGSSGMLSKGGEMTGAALASASTTALLLLGGVAMSMSSGCTRKKAVKSLDGATWRPNTAAGAAGRGAGRRPVKQEQARRSAPRNSTSVYTAVREQRARSRAACLTPIWAERRANALEPWRHDDVI